MRLRDLLALALANLRRNRTRTLLTLVGVSIGVSALLALLSYGAGLQRNARTEFNALELYNTLRVTSSPSALDALSGMGSYQRDTSWLDTIPEVTLNDSMLQAIEQIDGVLAAYPEVVFPAELKANDREVVVTVEAVPMAFRELPAYQPTAGAFFEAAADSALLIAPSMAERLGYATPEDAIGETVEMTTASLDLRALQAAARAVAMGVTGLPIRKERHPMRIAGILPNDQQQVSGFVRVLAPLTLAQQLEKITFFSTLDLLMRRGAGGGYAALRVQLEDTDVYAPTKASIEELGVYVAGFRDQFKQLERLFLILDLALGVIGFIALLVATLGITNTMMMNVMERYHEIGVMKALGGDEGDLQRLFVIESAAIGVLGGIIGLLAGWLLTVGIDALVNMYLTDLGLPALSVFYTPVLMVVGILALALLISLIAGVAPARRAARIEPIEALRTA